MKNVRPNIILLFVAIISSLLSFIIFYTAKDNDFVALDDFAYIVNNPNILSFGWNTVVWAFTSYYEGNWHPVTMLSLALDRQLWGLDPFGYHLTNIVIHSTSVFISSFLFAYLLKIFSKKRINPLSERAIVFGSIAAALFFALHPLRVESVVWASERKDVLCMFFMVTSLLMYMRYAVKRLEDRLFACWKSPELPFALLLAAIAVMSKPTAVSLPIILCIIDWYPLYRVFDRRSLAYSILEKLPFFVVALSGAILTFFAQQIAMKYAPDVGLASRLLVSCKALLFYLVKTVWPTELTAFYMHPGNVASFALAEYILYAAMILMISLSAIWLARKNRVFPAFWLYYVITLIPMIGILQVGGQWAADRYSYLPALGVSLVWGGLVAILSDKVISVQRSLGAGICLILLAGQILFYAVLTLRQISVWRNTETLATRIIENTPHLSGAPYLARAIYRRESGNYQLALEDVGEAMKIALRRGLTRTYANIAFEQSLILKNLGRYVEALTIIEWGLSMCEGAPPPDAVGLRNELVRLSAGN